MARGLDPTLDLVASDRVMRELERKIEAAPAKARKTALRVLRRAVRSGKSAMSKEIRETVNLKKKQVDRSIRAGVDSARDLAGYVAVRNRSVSLIEFMTPRQVISAIRAGRTGRSKGVAVKVHKKRAKQLYRGTFVAVMSNGRAGVYRRRTKKRLPIDKKYGPNLTTEFEKSLPAFAKRQVVQFEKELLRVFAADVDIT